jgi:hypothetical protein
LPARFVIEDLRTVFQHDLAENLGHRVQVLNGIQRQRVVAAGQETVRTPAILGRTAAATPGAAWVQLGYSLSGSAGRWASTLISCRHGMFRSYS